MEEEGLCWGELRGVGAWLEDMVWKTPWDRYKHYTTRLKRSSTRSLIKRPAAPRASRPPAALIFLFYVVQVLQQPFWETYPRTLLVLLAEL